MWPIKIQNLRMEKLLCSLFIRIENLCILKANILMFKILYSIFDLYDFRFTSMKLNTTLKAPVYYFYQMTNTGLVLVRKKQLLSF